MIVQLGVYTILVTAVLAWRCTQLLYIEPTSASNPPRPTQPGHPSMGRKVSICDGYDHETASCVNQ